MTTPVVYRVYDAADRLIYVGATTNLDLRLNTHRTSSWWHSLTNRVEWEPYPSMKAALAAEKDAIHAESPAFNIRGMGGESAVKARLTPADVEVCRAWRLSKRRGGYLPVALRWSVWA